MEWVRIAMALGNQLDAVWTFMLLLTRFTSMMLVLPGIGGGFMGLTVRMPAVLLFSVAAMATSAKAAVPSNVVLMGASLASEVLLGGMIAMVPLLIITGIRTGAHVASTSMGLGAGQLFDPVSNTSTGELAKLFGDVATIVFLLLGGHYYVIGALSGVSEGIAPGTFLVTEVSIDEIATRTAQIFTVGAMVAAPVLVALLITQFVLGLMSRSVPQLNIFIISFPLTIGIGLLLSMAALPEMVRYVERLFLDSQGTIVQLLTA